MNGTFLCAIMIESLKRLSACALVEKYGPELFSEDVLSKMNADCVHYMKKTARKMWNRIRILETQTSSFDGGTLWERSKIKVANNGSFYILVTRLGLRFYPTVNISTESILDVSRHTTSANPISDSVDVTILYLFSARVSISPDDKYVVVVDKMIVRGIKEYFIRVFAVRWPLKDRIFLEEFNKIGNIIQAMLLRRKVIWLNNTTFIGLSDAYSTYEFVIDESMKSVTKQRIKTTEMTSELRYLLCDIPPIFRFIKWLELTKQVALYTASNDEGEERGLLVNHESGAMRIIDNIKVFKRKNSGYIYDLNYADRALRVIGFIGNRSLWVFDFKLNRKFSTGELAPLNSQSTFPTVAGETIVTFNNTEGGNYFLLFGTHSRSFTGGSIPGGSDYLVESTGASRHGGLVAILFRKRGNHHSKMVVIASLEAYPEWHGEIKTVRHMIQKYAG